MLQNIFIIKWSLEISKAIINNQIDYLNPDGKTIQHSFIRTIKTIKETAEGLFIVTFKEWYGNYGFTKNELNKMIIT